MNKRMTQGSPAGHQEDTAFASVARGQKEDTSVAAARGQQEDKRTRKGPSVRQRAQRTAGEHQQDI